MAGGRSDAAIEQVVREANGPLSADEIHAALAAAGRKVGIATVYRAVRRVTEAGRFSEVQIGDGPARYEPADRPHHHHFVCDDCQHVFDFDGCPGGIADLAPKGFEVGSHEIVLHGKCRDCK